MMRRRTWLAAAAGLTVTFTAGCALPVIPKRPKPQAEDALSWIRHADGRYTLYVPRAELGQNILTALKQVACDELGIDWAQLDARLPATTDVAPVRGTVGSESIKDFALPLAQACATLREALAAGQRQGVIAAKPLPPEALRSLRGMGPYVGRPVPLEQAPAIVRGQPLYASDVRRPGMVYGRVLRDPASPELPSRLQAMDEAAARAVPGFVALVRDPLLRQGESEGIGIVVSTPGALDRVEAALAVRWQVDGSFAQADIDALLDIDARLAREGSLGRQLEDGRIAPGTAWDVDLRFDIPLAAHAPLETRAAVAEFAPDGLLRLWVGTQDLFYVRDVVAKRLDLDPARVQVQAQRVGGAFGGKTICTVEMEAAVLARAVRAPVKLQWTRAQEFLFAFHRPPSSHRLRVALKDGRLHTWWHAQASSHILFTNAVLPPWLQRLANLVGDDGVARGAVPPYRAPVRRVELDVIRLPVLTGPWRGLGAGPNGFAIECTMDECARRAGADPLRFRLDHVQDPRLARVLQRVAEACAWDAPRPAAPPDLRRGRGLACGIYKGNSYVAVVADVEVQRDGSVRLTQLWCAHDAGRLVNPDQVRAQCEGNLVWGIGMVFSDRLPVADGRVAAASFADAPIPRMSEVPPMQVLLVDSGDAPGGAGETAIVAAGAAVANALREATGVRLQRLPLQPAALAAKDE